MKYINNKSHSKLLAISVFSLLALAFSAHTAPPVTTDPPQEEPVTEIILVPDKDEPNIVNDVL